MARKGLMEQDFSKLDVAKIHPLSTVISRQATINIGAIGHVVHGNSTVIKAISDVQEWASEHVSTPFRAPELWDFPSQTNIDERTDVWSLGCTLFAIMYGASPFEYALGESGRSLQFAIINGQIKWPAGPKPPYPEALHQFVPWMLQPQATVRPRIDDIIIHVNKLSAKFSQ